MKKVLVLTAAMMIAVPVCAQAAAWSVPSNVRVVQKSNTDTAGRVYRTIQAAINSISGETATNPFIVKVMPGIYNETISMKSFVTVEGSGVENTIITATASATEGFGCTTGTLKMANDSVAKNLTVKRTFTGTGYNGNSVNAIAVSNVKAVVDGVKAEATSINAQNADGICIAGDAANLEVLNSTIIATNTGGNQANAVYADGGASIFTAKNSKFIGYNNGTTGDIINYETTGAVVKISDSEIVSAGTSGATYILNGNGSLMTVTNSKIIGSCHLNPDYDNGKLMILANNSFDLGITSVCQNWNHPNIKFIGNYNASGAITP